MIKITIIHSLILFSLISCKMQQKTVSNINPRLLITTDIGGDPDDQQSLVRLLLYANEFDIEGLIASTIDNPQNRELYTQIVRSFLIKEKIDAYAKVFENLKQHSADFPVPEKLYQMVKSGSPYRGVEFIGEGHDTEASDWIVQQIKKDDPRPLNIAIWGGQTDVLQALWRIKKEYSDEKYKQIISNIRIYDIDDQDGIFDYIKSDFPDVFYLLNKAPKGKNRLEAAFRGMYLEGNMDITSKEWIYENIKTNHGPLGALYPDRTWTSPNPHRCMKEGDTPSWYYFLKNGLQDPEHPEFGGWGGRFKNDHKNYYVDTVDEVDTVKSARATVWRWREVFQNDFAARMDWCVRSFEEANHHPTAIVNNNSSKEVIKIKTKAGNPVILDAGKSKDIDGDKLSFFWWVYPEPSGLNDLPKIENNTSEKAKIMLTENLSGKEIHVVLGVTDNGQPALTSYRRVILKVE